MPWFFTPPKFVGVGAFTTADTNRRVTDQWSMAVSTRAISVSAILK